MSGQQQTSNPPEQAMPPVNTVPSDTTTMSVNLQSSPAPHHHVCLLKTTVVTVTHGSNHASANVLFDEGSLRSFVTKSLANTLKLKSCQKEDINLSTFGANYQLSHQVDIAMVNLLTKGGDTVLLSFLVVPCIATPLQNTRINLDHLIHLHDLQLAHPLTAETEFEISLLIGADHNWDIVGDRVVRGMGPTAVESKLGYLLSGPVQPTANQSTTANVLMVTTSPSEFDLEWFWNLESVGESPTDDNAEDDMLEQYLTSSVTRNDDGAYVARFP